MLRFTIFNLISFFVLINLQSKDLFVSSADSNIVNRVKRSRSSPSLWPQTIPYQIDSSLTDTSSIEAVLKEITDKTCIDFVVRTNEPDYITFTSTNNECSTSSKVSGSNVIELTPFCNCKNNIMELLFPLLGGFYTPNENSDCDAAELSVDNIQIIDDMYCPTIFDHFFG